MAQTNFIYAFPIVMVDKENEPGALAEIVKSHTMSIPHQMNFARIIFGCERGDEPLSIVESF